MYSIFLLGTLLAAVLFTVWPWPVALIGALLIITIA